MNTDTDQRTPAGLKVFLLAVAVVVVLGAACLVVWAFSPFDAGGSRPAYSTSPQPVPGNPPTEIQVPRVLAERAAELRRTHSARIAS